MQLDQYIYILKIAQRSGGQLGVGPTIVLSIKWRAHGMPFCDKTTMRSLVFLILNLRDATRPSTTCSAAQREDSRYLDATTVNFEFLVSHYKAVLEYLRAKGA